MEAYDLIVIGGGPAGYNGAEYAAKQGMKVLLVERDQLGGTCLNVGCIPTKAFLYAAKTYHYAKGGDVDYGIQSEQSVFQHHAVISKKDEMVKTLVKGVEGRLRKHKIEVVRGEASLGKSGDRVWVRAAGKEYIAKKILIATGSAPSIPPIGGINEAVKSGFLVTSNEVLSMAELPRHLIIVGGGVIGFEMAAYFREAGVKVTVIEMSDKVLGACDQEVSSLLQKKLEAQGVVFYLGAKVIKVNQDSIQFTDGTKEQVISCDKLLMAAGRRANIDISGLRELGVSVEKGVIVVDDCCRTNVANVYAAGDVIGKVTLAHVGYREGEVAVNHMLGQSDRIDYSAICSVVYTNPEAAFVGITEKEAKEAGFVYDVKKISINFSGRHVIERGMDEGLCKLIIDRKKNIIIGASLMSAYASEYIYALALMIQNKLPIDSIKKTVFPHPTVCEIIREALME